MMYEFDYFDGKEETTKIIYADSNREAVLKFYEEVGAIEFGCIRQDGEVFTDMKYLPEKKLIMVGC